MEKHITFYASRFRENTPCNTVLVVVFFVFFIALDHIRGLVTLVSVFCLLPLHCNKKESSEVSNPGSFGNQHPLAMCTNQPGVHRSCAAIYFVCVSTGLSEAMALSLDRSQNAPKLPLSVHAVFLLALWIMTISMAVLLFDSLTLMRPPVHDIELAAAPKQRRTELDHVARAPE